MPRGVGVRVPLSALSQDEQRKLFVFFCVRAKGLAKHSFATPLIFTFPLNPPLTKGDLWQVFHLLIFDDTPITFQHLSAQRIFETTVLV